MPELGHHRWCGGKYPRARNGGDDAAAENRWYCICRAYRCVKCYTAASLRHNAESSWAHTATLLAVTAPWIRVMSCTQAARLPLPNSMVQVRVEPAAAEPGANTQLAVAGEVTVVTPLVVVNVFILLGSAALK